MTVKTLKNILENHDNKSEVYILVSNNGQNFNGFVKIRNISKSISGPNIDLLGCIICTDQRIISI